MRYTYLTKDTCSKEIGFDIDGDIISNISFVGGCNGNLKALSILLEGKTVSFIENTLKGNLCGRRPTSCTDQLAIAVREAFNKIQD